MIEKASGKKYEQALRDMILTPLGMTDTGYDWSKTIIPRRASGYSGRGAALVNAAALDMQQPYAAGALYSTVEDLLKWDQALYTEKLLPAAAKQVMWTPFKENYAYGWIVSDPAPALFGGHRRLAHTGGINGFSSVIVRLPEPNVTFIVLANNDTANAAMIAHDVAAIYYGQPYTVPAEHTVAKIDLGGARSLHREIRAGARLRRHRHPRGQQSHDPGHWSGQVRGVPGVGHDLLREGDAAHDHLRHGRRRQGDALPAQPGRPGSDGEANRIARQCEGAANA